jgi:hypothetical protein
MNLSQARVPRVRKGYAPRGEVAVRKPLQRSDNRQRAELGKLSARLIQCEHRVCRQDRLVFMLRDLEADRFARRSHIPHEVFERFRDRRRRGRKVEKNANSSHVHLRRNVQPEERIVRLGRGELEEPMLGSEGYTAGVLRQPTARKLDLQ